MRKPETRRASALIKEKFSDIYELVDKGYTLPAIYQSWVNKGELSCSLSNFRQYYYKEKNRRAKFSVPTDEPLNIEKVDTKQPAPKAEASNSLAGIDAQDPQAQDRLADMIFRRNRQ